MIRFGQRPVDYPDDCNRISRALADKGYDVSLHEAQRLWEEYSEKYGASWLMLPGDDAVLVSCLAMDDE